MSAPSSVELIIRWLQIVIGLGYPVVLVVILFLAWRDWHRWVNHQLSGGDELGNQVQEFIE